MTDTCYHIISLNLHGPSHECGKPAIAYFMPYGVTMPDIGFPVCAKHVNG